MKVASFIEGSLIDKEIIQYSQLIQCLRKKSFDKGIISNVGNEDLAQLLFPFYFL